ncbi:MAG: amidohydrolase family protein [Chloroflexota bacterium]
MNIVDSHFHFWDRANLNYDWLDEVPAINRPFLPADYARQVGKHTISQKIFVQAGSEPEQAVKEAGWVSELAQTDPTIQAIVAFAPLELGDRATAVLDQLKQFPLVKGIRRLIQSEPLGFSNQPDFVCGVQLLPTYDFSFDICVKYDQMDDVLKFVAQCPEVQFVLDHAGKPAIEAQVLDPWRAQINQLAQHENVVCKLSGLVTEADHENWQPADLSPVIDQLLESFGPSRLMFGSDWPVVTLASSLEPWIDLALEVTSHLSAAEREQIFVRNAQRFYKLKDAPPTG